MSRLAIILYLSSLAGLFAAERPDLLRFTNNDQLHGSFQGIKSGPRAVWLRDDLEAPVDFKTERVRHIVLHGGRPIRALESLSHAGLVNGDRIPGTITGIDDEQITIDTGFAGMLHIPRKQVSILSPNPLGGRVYYHGPFSEDDWKMKHPAFPDGLPDSVPEDQDPPDDGNMDEDAADSPGRWGFSGSAWYWRGETPGTALVRQTGLPDRAVLSFNLAWKNRLGLAVAFHADFAPVKPEEDADMDAGPAGRFAKGGTANLPPLFGNSYVLQLTSNYLMIFRTSVDTDGNPSLKRVQLNNSNLRLGETGNAKVEIRSNLRSEEISLFVNDEFVGQWSESNLIDHDGRSFSGKSSGFGFVAQSRDAPVRISDIVVSEWNGMPDSARSLQVDDQDVVLMANGTDRYAGKVGQLDTEGKLLFEGKHGSFRFPLAEVAEIRFARNQLATAGETPADNVLVRLNPIGLLSGRPVSGDGTTLGIVSPIIGDLNLSLDSAVMLEFNASNQFINDWDADF